MPTVIIAHRVGVPVLSRNAMHARLDARGEKDLDQVGIELRPTSVGEGAHTLIEALRGTVAAPVGDGVERVGDGHDTRLDRNLLTDEAVRVPGAIPAFVMREH